MRPGERVEALKQLAAKLSSEDGWPTIDLVLREFGFPITERWDGDRHGYCLEMLRQGSDDDVLRLQEYYFGHDPDPSETDLVWRAGEFRLFISHINVHKSFALQLAQHLAWGYGVHAFVAHEDIEPNREWEQVILNSLRSCEALVALLHPGFHESRWTDQEVGYVLGRSRPVLSVRFGLDPYGFLGRHQGIAGGAKEPSVIAVEIVNVLMAEARTSDSMTEALVNRLVHSTSFNCSNNVVAMLRRHSPISASQIERIRQAQKVNIEVSGAFEVEPYLATLSHIEHASRTSPITDDEPF